MMNEVNYPGYMMPRGLRLLRRCRLVCDFRSRFHSDHDCRVNHRVYQSMGMFLALGEIVGRKLSSHILFAGCVSMA